MEATNALVFHQGGLKFYLCGFYVHGMPTKLSTVCMYSERESPTGTKTSDGLLSCLTLVLNAQPKFLRKRTTTLHLVMDNTRSTNKNKWTMGCMRLLASGQAYNTMWKDYTSLKCVRLSFLAAGRCQHTGVHPHRRKRSGKIKTMPCFARPQQVPARLRALLPDRKQILPQGRLLPGRPESRCGLSLHSEVSLFDASQHLIPLTESTLCRLVTHLDMYSWRQAIQEGVTTTVPYISRYRHFIFEREGHWAHIRVRYGPIGEWQAIDTSGILTFCPEKFWEKYTPLSPRIMEEKRMAKLAELYCRHIPSLPPNSNPTWFEAHLASHTVREIDRMYKNVLSWSSEVCEEWARSSGSDVLAESIHRRGLGGVHLSGLSAVELRENGIREDVARVWEEKVEAVHRQVCVLLPLFFFF